MPRGKYTNHKGRARRFTNPDDLEKQRKQDEYKKFRKPNEFEEESEEEEEEEKDETSEEEETESEEDESGKAKGIEGLIPIENPNRIQKKAKKLSAINEVLTGAGASGSAGPQLSRREREEVVKQRAEAHYKKLHAEGKTEEARADLARLAIIKQQREEAAKKREQEKKLKETAKSLKNVESLKAIGKKKI